MYQKWELTEWGKQVETLRNERNIRKSDLCKRLKISPSYYDLITHGQRTGYKQLDRILEVLTEPTKEAP